MKLLTIARWQVMFDLDATVAAFAAGNEWGEKGCQCGLCKNFHAAIDQAYPPEFISILGLLGLRPGQETEVFQVYRMDTGLHSYGGWFYFVGSLLAGADGWRQVTETSWTPDTVKLSARFSYLLSSKTEWIPTPFKNKSIVQVGFYTQIPWVTDAEEPG